MSAKNVDPDETQQYLTSGSAVSALMQEILSKTIKINQHYCGPYKWAKSWENLFIPYANNKVADQPVHLLGLICAIVVHCLNSIIPTTFAKSKISKLWLVTVAEQAGLSITWSKTPMTGFLVTWLNYEKWTDPPSKDRTIHQTKDSTAEILKILACEKFAVITLKFEQGGFIIE